MQKRLLSAIGIVIVAALLLVATVALSAFTGCARAGGPAATTTATTSNDQPLTVNIDSQKGLWVNGQGKVTLVPDIAMINLGISAKAVSVAEAQAQAATAMDKLMAALAASGIDKKDIQTTYFSIQPNYNYNKPDGTSTITGYTVSNTVSVKIKDVDKTGQIIDSVAAATGDYIRINGISFSVEKPELYYAQARDLAMKDAKAKAEDLARLTGVTLGKPVYITESTGGQPIYYPTYAKAADSGVPTTSISPGETQVTLSVQVGYEVQ